MNIFQRFLILSSAAGLIFTGSVSAQIGKALNSIESAIRGAAAGGKAGVAISKYMEKQAAEIKASLPSKVEIKVVGQGIEIIYPSNLLFKDTSSSDLTPEAKNNLANLAAILNKYQYTNILIAGFTDQKKDLQKGVDFSNQLAKSVEDYLNSQKVQDSRTQSVGYGASQPVSNNTSAKGRERNNRIDMGIYASDELKAKALNGEI